MVFNNHYNSSDDDEFLANFPDADEVDSPWVDEELESKRSCGKCEWYNNSMILPCAINPSNAFHPDDCPDYSPN